MQLAGKEGGEAAAGAVVGILRGSRARSSSRDSRASGVQLSVRFED